MPIKFEDVSNPAKASHLTRFPQSAVNSNATFKWHRFAPPPTYSLCLVKIIDLLGGDKVKIVCFDAEANGSEPLEIDLADRNQAWHLGPSTIRWPQLAPGQLPTETEPPPLPAKLAELGEATCAVLCLSDAALSKLATPKLYKFVKYPYGEDAVTVLMKKIAGLKGALDELRPKVTAQDFDAVLAKFKLNLDQ
jgi:hypothetical protein